MFLLHNWWSIKLGADKLIQLFTGKSWVYVILASKFAFVIKKIGVKLLWNFNHYFQTCSIKTSALNHALYTSENTSVSFSKFEQNQLADESTHHIYLTFRHTTSSPPPPKKKWKYFHELKILNTEISSFSLLEIRAKSLKAKCTNENCFWLFKNMYKR